MKWADVDPKYPFKGVKGKGGSKKKTTPFKLTKFAQKTKKLPTKAELQKYVQDKYPKRGSRSIWMGEKAKSGRSHWEGFQEGVIEDAAIHHQLVKSKVKVPVGHEIVSDDLGPKGEQIFGKVQKAPEGTGGGALEEYEATVVKREPVGKGGVYWRGGYTGEKITLDEKKAGGLQLDHIVPIFRAAASGKFKTNKQKYEFVKNLKNLVVSKTSVNQEKGSYGLAKWQPKQQEQKEFYAKAYHDVFKHYGMKMTVGEASKYTEITGLKPTVGVWNQKKSDDINTFMDKERQMIANRMKSRP